MDFKNYKKRFKIACSYYDIPNNEIEALLNYAEKLNIQSLPIIFDVVHMGQLIGYESQLFYKISNGTRYFYRTFKIKKSSGHHRIINEPYPTLKEIQYWILYNILETQKVSKFAKAYVKNIKLYENARFHQKQSVVIKIDIKNFFGSVKIQRVYSLFLSMNYTPAVSAMLANLCCLNNNLPQGAPTSPYISNLIMKEVDKRISAYALKNKYRYTRYSDDITVSGQIENDGISKIINLIALILKENGFEIKKSKTKVLRQSNRQIITGIVVNEKNHIQRDKKKRIRQEMYYISKFGVDSHMHFANIDKKNYLKHLQGKINWVLSIEKGNEEFIKYKIQLSEIIQSF